MNQREHERRNAEENRKREQEPPNQISQHRYAKDTANISLIPFPFSLFPYSMCSRRSILASPWRVTPSDRAARARLPPARASAAARNRRSNSARAASNVVPGSTALRATWDGSNDGPTRPLRGASTA